MYIIPPAASRIALFCLFFPAVALAQAQSVPLTATATAIVSPVASPTATAVATPTAQAVPAGEPRCNVAGRILNIQRGEGLSAASGQLVAVPVLQLEVESSVALDPAYKGLFCQQLVGQPLQGQKPVVNFRLCDGQTEVFTSDRIRGVAGRNLGGGFYCLEQVVRTLE